MSGTDEEWKDMMSQQQQPQQGQGGMQQMGGMNGWQQPSSWLSSSDVGGVMVRYSLTHSLPACDL